MSDSYQKQIQLFEPDSLNEELTILVMSCDSYADLWEPFIFCLKCSWNGPLPKTVLVTDTIQQTPLPYDSVLAFSGEWSSRLHQALDCVKTPYVLLLLEDFLASSEISSSALYDVLQDLKRFQAATIRLMANPKRYCVRNEQFEPYLELPHKSPYRVSTMPGIWYVTYLKNISEYPRSAWDFERLGSVDSDQYPQPVLCSPVVLFHFTQGVIRGKWARGAVRFCRKTGVPIDLGRRMSQSISDVCRKKVLDVVWNICPRLIVSVQNRISRRQSNKY